MSTPVQVRTDRNPSNREVHRKRVAGRVALAEPALDEHGQAIDPAENNHVEPERGRQTARNRSFHLGRGAGPSKKRQADRESEQQRDRDEDGPDGHMDAKNRAADVSVSRAWKEIEQGLPRGNHQEQHRENEADAGASLRAVAAQLDDQPKAATEHGDTLEQTQRAGNLPADKLDSHRRGEDARQGEQHQQEDQPIQRHAQRQFPVFDYAHGSIPSDRGEEWSRSTCSQGILKP